MDYVVRYRRRPNRNRKWNNNMAVDGSFTLTMEIMDSYELSGY